MLRHALLLSLTAASLLPTRTQDDQAFFAILAETKVGRVAGMELPDLKDLPPGIKLPPQAMMFMGVPSKILNIRLWSPKIAPPDAFAWVAPPAGLKQGDRLDLELYRPKPADATGGKSRDFDPDSNPDFTVKIYWGSSETVREGQPKIIKWTGLTPEQMRAMKEQQRKASAAMQAGGDYFYKEDWTTGYWPTKKQPGNIDEAASLVGKYVLTTNYTGNVEIEAPSNVNFLAPIALSSPNLEQKVDLNNSIKFQWAQIPNALGLHAGIMGTEGKNTLILWTSSEVYADEIMGDLGFLQMAEVRERVEKTLFMAGDRTEVFVPKGIFANADVAMLQMAGYGPGAALDKAQPLPRIQTKTNLQVMLGGKKMGDIGLK